MTATLKLAYGKLSVIGWDDDGQISVAVFQPETGTWLFQSQLLGDSTMTPVARLACTYEEAIDHVLVHLGQKDSKQ